MQLNPAVEQKWRILLTSALDGIPSKNPTLRKVIQEEETVIAI